MGSTVGVLFVHGVGNQGEGSTLARFGDPFIGWMERWTAGHGGKFELVASPDCGIGPRHVHSNWDRPGAEPVSVVLAESWWATRFEAPSLRDVIKWGPHILYRAEFRYLNFIKWLFVALAVLLYLLLPVNFWVYMLGFVGVCAVALLVLPLAVLVVLGVLAAFPPTRGLARILIGLSTSVAGDAWVLLHSPTRFAAMRDKVAEDMRWLEAHADKTVVVAHSQGSVVTLEVLVASPALQCDLFLTVGSAVRLLRLPSGDPVERLRAARPGMRWINVYSQLDPVAGGPIGEGHFPQEVIAANGGSALHAHNAYVDNAEGFQAVLQTAAGHVAWEKGIFDDDESLQFARAHNHREYRNALRTLSRLLGVAAVIAVADLVGRWARSPEANAITAKLPKWLREVVVLAASPGTGGTLVRFAAAALLVFTYGYLVVNSAHQSWHRSGAAALARGTTMKRVTWTCVLYIAVLLPLSAVAIWAGLMAGEWWTFGAIASSGLVYMVTGMMMYFVGTESITDGWKVLDVAFLPAVPES